MQDERSPPVRLLYADELGQLKGEYRYVISVNETAIAAMHAAQSPHCRRRRLPPAVVQTADGTRLGTAAVAATW